MIESINLNLIPSGVSPVCHVSQYDAGRQIKINLFEGINPYTIQSGDAFTLNVRKPDNTIVTTSVSGTQGNTYITISTTEQIAAVVGENLCELKITNGSTVIGTLNFVMLVERDVLADGIPSQSVIEDLDERIAEAIGDNYYNKNETDALLALKADKTEFYNFYPTEQESGAIASFTDGAENIPVKSLVSQIVAVESGNGQPKSPTNPYTISGFDSGVVSVIGKNWFDFEGWLNANSITYTKTGDSITFTPNSSLYTNPYVFSDRDINVSASVTNFTFNGTNLRLDFLNENDVPQTSIAIGGLVRNNFNACKVRLNWSTMGTSVTIDKPMINLGTTAETYEAYNGNDYTFTFGQTVYGGHFDNKGNLVVERVCKRLTTAYNLSGAYQGSIIYNVSSAETSDADFTKPIMCNNLQYVGTSTSDFIYGTCINYLYTSFNLWLKNGAFSDLAEATQWLANNPTYICYYLANPITLSITSQDIPTLLGVNNIFSDTGDVDVTIRADIGLYIDKRLNVSRSTPNNLIRAAAYVNDPESVNETQEDNVEPQNDER